MRINISIDTTDEEFNHFLESCRKTDSAFSAPSTAAKESAGAELAVSDEVLANFSRVLDEQLEECEKWESGIVGWFNLGVFRIFGARFEKVVNLSNASINFVG